MGRGDTNISRRHKGRGVWDAQYTGLEAKHMMLESALSETAETITTTTPPTIRDGRGPPTAQVSQPKGPKPMSKQPFKVGFQNVHRGIANANVILEEEVKRD